MKEPPPAALAAGVLAVAAAVVAVALAVAAGERAGLIRATTRAGGDPEAAQRAEREES